MNDDLHPIPTSPRCLDAIADVELRVALMRLFERTNDLIRAHEGEQRVLVVLVSRRMTCLYDMLLGDDFPGLVGGEVVSDRALDADSVEIAGRRIVLLDDAFILGSTLADLYDKLVDPDDPARVTTMVACVDRQRFSRALLAHVGVSLDGPDAPCLRDTKQLEAFAFELASCLYQAGVPYFSDFPVVKELEQAVPHSTNCCSPAATAGMSPTFRRSKRSPARRAMPTPSCHAPRSPTRFGRDSPAELASWPSC